MNLRSLKWIFPVFILLFVFESCGIRYGQQKAKVSFVSYQFPDSDLEMEIPENWDDEIPAGLPLEVDLVCKSESEGEGDDFIENLVLLHQDVANGNFEEVMKAQIAAFEAEGRFHKINKYQTGSLNQIKFAVLDHEYLVQRRIRALQFFYLEGETLWVLTCSALPQSFSRYEKLFNYVGNSIHQ